MSIPVIVAAALFVGVLAYGLLGGADFGSGFYDLLAGGDEKGRGTRTQIDHSIGPVWEANHVWLIYVLVMWWTGFPRAFAAAMSTLIVPMFLALLGIVLRGATFAFRKYAPTITSARLYGIVFAASSVVTPFFLGAVVGAVASGRVPAAGRGDAWTSWLTPTSMVAGIVAVGTSIFLAGNFLTADAHRAGDTGLVDRLRRQTLVVGTVTGLVAFAAVGVLWTDAPTLAAGLRGRAAPLVAASAVFGAANLACLWRRRYRAVRILAPLAVLSVLCGWAVGQYPWFLVDQMGIDQAAGAPATLHALLVVAALAGVVVLPPLVWLFRLSLGWAGTEAHH